jgi:hypothetical protein
MIVGGSLCLLLSLALLFLAIAYLTGGAGLQFIGVFGLPSIIVGSVHLMGLLLAAGICFCLGVALLAHAVVKH